MREELREIYAEMEAYSDKRSEAWHETERAEQHSSDMSYLDDAANALESIDEPSN